MNYRNDPVAFFELTLDEQTGVLESLYGPLNTVVFRHEDFSEDRETLIKDDAFWESIRADIMIYVYSKLTDCFGDWHRMAAIMKLFEIPYINITPNLAGVSYDGFIDAFAFGCFRGRHSHGFFVDTASFMFEWTKGNVGERFIRELIDGKYSNTTFERACEKICESECHVHTVVGVLNQINLHRVSSERRNCIFGILSQKRLVSDLGDTLTPYFYLVYQDHVRYQRLNLKIPKPIWTRQNHLQITSDANFRKEAFVVVCMQKLRFESFSLHKDLVAIVIGKLFELHLLDLEKRVDRKNELMDKYVYDYFLCDKDERFRFCLRQGICIKKFLEPKIGQCVEDSILLSMGLPINEREKDFYFSDLCHAMCRAVYGRDYHHFTDLDVLREGEDFIRHCDRHEIPYYNVIKGYVKLKRDCNVHVEAS